MKTKKIKKNIELTPELKEDLEKMAAAQNRKLKPFIENELQNLSLFGKMGKVFNPQNLKS